MSVQLKPVPAFGFEWDQCNANEARLQYIRDHALTAVEIQAEEVSYFAMNFFKVLGAILPLVGIGRIFDAVFYTEHEGQALSIIRGLMEISGLGIVAIGIDVFVTLGRAFAISYNRRDTELYSIKPS